MRILIADDDRVGTAVLARALSQAGFEVMSVQDGDSAWRTVQDTPDLRMVICDWEMPGLEGPALCQQIRNSAAHAGLYVILLTGRIESADIVSGLDAGADDYVAKPFDTEELKARVRVGARIVMLQTRLAERVNELQSALSEIKQLSGLLPICSYCKRIRSDNDYWEQVDRYIAQHSGATFTHGICPHCYDAVAAEFDAAAMEASGGQ